MLHRHTENSQSSAVIFYTLHVISEMISQPMSWLARHLTGALSTNYLTDIKRSEVTQEDWTVQLKVIMLLTRLSQRRQRDSATDHAQSNLVIRPEIHVLAKSLTFAEWCERVEFLIILCRVTHDGLIRTAHTTLHHSPASATTSPSSSSSSSSSSHHHHHIIIITSLSPTHHITSVTDNRKAALTGASGQHPCRDHQVLTWTGSCLTRKPCCRKETARCRKCSFPLKFANNIHYKYKKD